MTGIGRQEVNGSPVKDGGQEQIGICFTTVHIASEPHVPGQGSMHL